jgi:hypothetical protein
LLGVQVYICPTKNGVLKWLQLWLLRAIRNVVDGGEIWDRDVCVILVENRYGDLEIFFDISWKRPEDEYEK